MGDRFLALIGIDDAGRRRARRLAETAARTQGLAEVSARSSLRVLAASGMPVRSAARGLELVLGQLFQSGDGYPDAPKRLPDGLLAHDGGALLRRYWGGYVAISLDPTNGQVRVLRDPSAASPVYFTQTVGLVAFASDLAILRALDLVRLEVNWAFVRHHLAFSALRLGATGLSAVRELLGGEAAIVTGDRLEVRAAWTPQAYAPQAARQSFEAAVEAVGNAVRGCVRAMARGQGRLALQLSGGLDSSIVAGCLHGLTPDLACINLATGGRDGDERPYAEAVTRMGRWELTVLQPQPQAVSIDLAEPGLEPGTPLLLQDLLRLQSDAAQASGVDAVFTGGGGDNVFGCLASPALVADRLVSRGPGQAFWRSAAEMAEIRQSTTWRVARQAAGAALMRRDLWRADLRFLAPGAQPERRPHPWRRGEGATPPGRGLRIDSIIGLQSQLDPAQRPSAVKMLHPLAAQPVIEACLGAPSWHWIRGGVDRAVARAAFADCVPDVVLQRRSKGSLNSHFSQVYAMSRPLLANLLPDGVLAQRGLLDVAAVRTFLDQPILPRGGDFYRLFELADVEIWLRGCSGA